MLVISRRKGQRIAIGDDIEIVITEVHRSSVKIGISAPRGYIVLRGEVSDAISTANREAASITIERAGELASRAPEPSGAPNPIAARLGLKRHAVDGTPSQPGDAGPMSPAGTEASTADTRASRTAEATVATPKPGAA